MTCMKVGFSDEAVYDPGFAVMLGAAEFDCMAAADSEEFCEGWFHFGGFSRK